MENRGWAFICAKLMFNLSRRAEHFAGGVLMISVPLPLDMELTGSVIADVELLLALAALLGLFLLIMVRRPVWGLVSFIFLVLTRVHEYIPGSQAFRPRSSWASLC
jgi:hypothetical protein